ncbi:hypothetical protein BX616_005016 [Lobosporangium transversale]|uniref:Uncharacterized protein n=1 Tax=Lobosporangium transversale TaxID=64571 RepID=A0A1Y2GPN1_9FUNG|nr:hypothetical protein BCR41DRAFT_370034 [Lobosporangium transversale]KAF9897763.1 hypothetical protein BX616_005016 [Lobosporangium transversale]ORZ18220.1 hypothetical protein BCR41DRAFT_370034 [Lobosporangium transversale]|eukprot:XP_021882015.1 hypothetical protein BCR41DRAFT_370034 [Lobosporangium transversale]
MFLPFSIFTLNIILAVFQFLLVAVVGAILAIYSRSGDQYANSIRWSRQGGYVEMISSLYNSSYSVPSRTKWVMVATIVASLVAGVLDKGVARFISPTERLIRGDSKLEIIPQFQVLSREYIFSGWSTSIRHGENITEAMALMINNTRNIQTAEVGSGRLYIPRLTDFDIVCAQSSVHFLDDEIAYLLLTQEGCSNVYIYLYNLPSFHYNNTTVVQKSPHRWSLVYPGGKELLDASLGIDFKQSDTLCTLREFEVSYFGIFDEGGVNRLPSTVTTKCVREDGDVLVMAATTVRFTGDRLGFSNTTTRLFQGTDEIFQAMDALIKMTAPAPTKYMYHPTILAEVRVRGSMIDTVICTFRVTAGIPKPVCLYSVISFLVVRPKEQSVAIKRARGDVPFSSTSSSAKAMVIEHIPSMAHDERNLISIPQLQNDTVAVSQFMASLGQNFFTDYESHRLYVIYDVFDPEKGLEIPKWLLVVVIVVMVVCFCVWTLTEWLLDGKYTSSLYKTISIQLGSYNQVSAPRVMRVDVNPMKFEGILVIPIQEEMEMDKDNTMALLMDSP